MPHHNTFTAAPGKIVIYGEWLGTEYVERQAYIKSIVATPAGEDEPTINLRYSNGQGPALNANSVVNIELITGNDDYWRAQFDPVVQDSLPATITRPLQGDIVWLTVWDSTANDDYKALAFVRAIPGAPGNQTPDLQLSYWDVIVEDDVNINNVAPFDGFSGDDHWFDQKAAV